MQEKAQSLEKVDYNENAELLDDRTEKVHTVG